MIEIVYKDNVPEGEQEREIRTPKNVKQIGSGSGRRKIYIEDYVMNFVRKPPAGGEKADGDIRYGVLLGKIQRGEGGSYVFVQGAVEAFMGDIKGKQDEESAEPALFSGDVWNGIYDEIKRYFDRMEIVGWYLSKQEQQPHEMPFYNKVHLSNFSGMDKLFLAVDRTEKEEIFYTSEGSSLEREESYFIYYDRNEEMQQYMASKEPPQEIKEAEKVKQPKTVSFSVSSLLAVAALLAVVLLLNNYDSVAQLMGRGNNNAVVKETGESVKEAGNRVETQSDRESESRTEVGANDNESASVNHDEQQSTDHNETGTKSVDSGVEARYYTVQSGETLYEICMRVYKNPSMVDTVRELNGIDDDYLIREGQKIILP